MFARKGEHGKIHICIPRVECSSPNPIIPIIWGPPKGTQSLKNLGSPYIDKRRKNVKNVKVECMYSFITFALPAESRVSDLGSPKLGVIYRGIYPIMDNQIENKMANELETVIVWGGV